MTTLFDAYNLIDRTRYVLDELCGSPNLVGDERVQCEVMLELDGRTCRR